MTNLTIRRDQFYLRSGNAFAQFPLAALVGVLLASITMAIYAFQLTALAIPTPEAFSSLIPSATIYFVVLLCVGLVLFDIRRSVSKWTDAIWARGLVPLSPGWMIPYVLSIRKYRRYFVVTALLYGAFYAVITSMIVYQPSVDFAQAYGVSVPSAQVTPVPTTPLLTPVVKIYLINHLGLLLVPLAVLLLVATSVLVGLNSALAGFAFGSRARGAGKGWVGGMGAVVVMFTGYPTGVGLFFANFLGGTGAVSFAAFLGYYQPVFILLSILCWLFPLTSLPVAF